ncbi:MAG: hypothetical protein Q7J24_16820 [Desulfomicrobium sp.]|jgi:hypothetical protein|nr:hypothetical protein [Desulfomicrobium sp.]
MGGISLMDIVDKISAVLAADAELAEWADENFDKTVTILVGLDERNRPGPASCPLILIRPDGQGLGQSSGQIEHRVQIDWAVHDATVTTAGGITEYTGVRRVDEMGRLIWSALCAGISGHVAMDQAEYVLETVERFPLLLGGMDITINVPQLIGAVITL